MTKETSRRAMMWRTSFLFRISSGPGSSGVGIVQLRVLFFHVLNCERSTHLEFPTSRCDVMFWKMKEENLV